MTTVVALDQAPTAPLDNLAHHPNVQPAALPKDVYTKFPPGFIGDPSPFKTCTLAQFLTVNSQRKKCPASSALALPRSTSTNPRHRLLDLHRAALQPRTRLR